MGKRHRPRPCDVPAVEVSQARFGTVGAIRACELVGGFTSWQASIRAPLAWLNAVSFEVWGQTMGVRTLLEVVRGVDVAQSFTAANFSGIIGRFIGHAFDSVHVVATRTDAAPWADIGEAEVHVRGWCDSGGSSNDGGAIVQSSAQLWDEFVGPAGVGTTTWRTQATAGRRDNITSISLTTDDDTARQISIIRRLAPTSEIVAVVLMGGAGPDQHSITLPVPLRGFRATGTVAAEWQIIVPGSNNTGHFLNFSGYTD